MRGQQMPNQKDLCRLVRFLEKDPTYHHNMNDQEMQ